MMDFRTFKQKLQALAQQQSLGIQQCQEVEACCNYISPDCDVRAVAADNSVFTQLGQVAMLGIRAITREGVDSGVHQGVVATLMSLAFALQNTMQIFMEVGSYPWPSLPAGTRSAASISWAACDPM